MSAQPCKIIETPYIDHCSFKGSNALSMLSFSSSSRLVFIFFAQGGLYPLGASLIAFTISYQKGEFATLQGIPSA
ncbi:hypothetical protein AQUCO_00200295v1 [Aquilegia coerulea]|uniref:Uncharacterized protein n=1 Tax=Aquilegia coerulea TaxID=218851 RepID=A0A2G5F2J5_AQUCA|nr:hypothetical protein AQUCO_00200295v1 [Aquilegia coerulea]